MYALDTFGSFTGLRINGHHRLRSKFGGFSTIFCFIVFITTVIFYGITYISGTEISTISNILKFWNSQNITINRNFQFAIMNTYNAKATNRSDIWEIKPYYVVYDLLENKFNITNLEFKFCNRNNWESVEDQFDLLKIQDALCIDVNNLELSGNSYTKFYKYIKINYILKINDTASWNTFIENEIANISPIVTVYFKEGIFEVTGKQSKRSYFINAVSINNTFRNSKELDLSISDDSIVINEDRIFYTIPREQKAFVIGEYREKISVRATTSKHSMSINLVSARSKSITNIYFMSFSEMLARIGGIVNNTIMVFFIINYIINYFGFEMIQFNDYFKKIEHDFKNNSINIDNSKLLRTLNKDLENLDEFSHMNIEVNSICKKIEKTAITKFDKDNILNIKNYNLVKQKKLKEEKEEKQEEIKNDKSIIVNLKTNFPQVSDIRDVTTNNFNNDLSRRIDKKIDLSLNLRLIENESKLDKLDSSKLEEERINSENDLRKRVINKLKHSIDFSLYSLKNTSIKKLIHSDIKALYNLQLKKGKINYEIKLVDYIILKYCRFLLKCCNFDATKTKQRVFDLIHDYLYTATEIRNFEFTYNSIAMLKYILFDDDQISALQNAPFLSTLEIIKKINSFEIINSNSPSTFNSNPAIISNSNLEQRFSASNYCDFNGKIESLYTN